MRYKIRRCFIMKRRNLDIRKAKGNIPAWLIAEKLGIHEKTLYGWLRYEMSNEKKKEIMRAIDEAKKEFNDFPQKKEVDSHVSHKG